MMTRSARLLATVPLFFAALMLPLSFTGGVMTTPAIGHALGGSPLALMWLTNGFMLSFGGCLLGAGVAADKLGSRRLFFSGLLLFVVSCGLIGVAQSTWVVGGLRTLQGLAAALTLAAAATALAQLYEGAARTRAFSLLGTLFGLGLAFGPLLIGVLTQHGSWRWVYVVLALMAGLSLLWALRFLVVASPAVTERADWRGITLFTAALMLFSVALLLLPEQGMFAWPVAMLFALSLLLAVVFVRHCQRHPAPVFQLQLLRQPRFAGVLVLPVATCYCYVVLLIVIPLHFMGMQGMDEIDSALWLLALTSPMLVVPMLAALLTRWFSAGGIAVAGLLLAALGLLGLSFAVAGPWVLFAMFVIGCGAALPWGLMDGLAVSAVPLSQAGMAAGLFNTVRVAGEGIALALVVALLVALNHLTLGHALPESDPQALSAAANWLGSSNLAQARLALPEVDLTLILSSYQQAWQGLLWLLAAITLLTAVGVWLLLVSKNTTAVEQVQQVP